MPDPIPGPGDKVVDLAALLRATAVLTGAVASAASLWVLKHSALWVIGMVFPGGVVGFFLGSFLGPKVFPAGAGNVTIVKLGPGAFPVALKAGLVGAVCTGILAGTVPAVWLDPAQTASLAGTGMGIGVAIGAIGAFVATRP